MLKVLERSGIRPVRFSPTSPCSDVGAGRCYAPCGSVTGALAVAASPTLERHASQGEDSGFESPVPGIHCAKRALHCHFDTASLVSCMQWNFIF